jgi:two-component system chemotaxis sensor kinase CheA
VSIRVDLARIDALVDLAGELMLQHRRLSHGLRQIERATQGEARGQLARTGGDLVETGYLLEELQGTVRDLRLLPLRTLFDRYPRPIRDLARDHGKSIRVAMEGGELEADKRVLDLLGEPLLHLIRNAVDHGIESPRDRVAAGKPEEGNLTLVARHAAGRLEIVVRDDGRGLSEQAIRDVALTRGAISREEAEELRADQVIELLFQPGFSTKSATTDISGRGIGLHIVKQAVENLGGSVSVRSTPGQETSFVLDVPLTVALLQALVVSLDKLQLAIPSHAVSGVHRVSEGQLLAAGTGSAFRVDGALIALQDLGRLLGAGELSVPLAECRVVVVESKGNALGLIVPRVLGERELVQRPLDPFLRAIPKLVGAAILESGDPVLVLNVAEAVRAAASGPRAGARPEPGAEARERCVLIVEDSELTRDMLQRLVGALGHRVIEAVNGREALRRIAIQRPDLVLTDLEMPVMDGFQLIAEIRALEPLRDVPIVVLSSRGSPEDQRRAAALGADAYLVKSEFSEKALADTFARFLQEAAG